MGAAFAKPWILLISLFPEDQVTDGQRECNVRKAYITLQRRSPKDVLRISQRTSYHFTLFRFHAIIMHNIISGQQWETLGFYKCSRTAVHRAATASWQINDSVASHLEFYLPSLQRQVDVCPMATAGGVIDKSVGAHNTKLVTSRITYRNAKMYFIYPGMISSFS